MIGFPWRALGKFLTCRHDKAVTRKRPEARHNALRGFPNRNRSAATNLALARDDANSNGEEPNL